MMTLWAILSTALAGTVSVDLEVRGDVLTSRQVESIVWHALSRDLGHDAVFTTPGKPSPTDPVEHIEVLVQWDPQVLRVQGLLFATWAPKVTVKDRQGERSWVGTALVKRHDDTGWVSLPDAALMRTLDRVTNHLEPPTWHPVPELTAVPVVVAVDEEFRDTWGDQWVGAADLRIERASAVLKQSGVVLHVVGYEAMTTHDAHSMREMLRSIDAHPLPASAALRVGLTGQVQAERAIDVEDVAIAFVPGSTLLVADQIPSLPSLAGWDACEEGTALAHEVIHSFGVPHLAREGFLMSEVKAGMVHQFSSQTREAIETAAKARSTRDAMQAVQWLEQVATTMDDRKLALQFITHNLNAGIGVPDPGLVDPERLTPLANVAIGRHYLARAASAQSGADLYRRMAALHSRAAAARIDPQDAWADVLGSFEAELCKESPWHDANGQPVCDEAPPGTSEIDIWNQILDEL